ncbi:uncharacterized protein LOC112570540 [Pomacea canaliculata]|uniref:uncharacterized protein LOC112570540 n=1 Tax=Pomacea canaliculata TaxID=400727 RepID=UPI000D7302C5|nr:uncharacterized protein LOC112570540 [Pomacea canaliculata]
MASFRSTKTHFKNLSRRFLEGEVIEERGAAAEAEDELYRLVPSDNEDGDDDDVDRDGRRETVVQYYNEQELGNGDTIKATIENTPNKRKKSLRKRVRRRVWKAMRSSWKYVRRGMEDYSRSTGMAAMFLWGANFSSPNSWKR